jgi:hypothetical protein
MMDEYHIKEIMDRAGTTQVEEPTNIISIVKIGK